MFRFPFKCARSSNWSCRIIRFVSDAPNPTKSSSGGNSAKHGLGPVSWASLGLMTLVGGGLALFYQMEKERKTKSVTTVVTNVGKPSLGGPWVLVDQNGKPVTDASFFGQYTLLYFGFTYCPDICPNELVKIGKIVDELEKRKIKSVQPIFISVDPKRDSIGQLRNYGQDFHENIQYLTGTTEQVAAAAKAFRVYFNDDYLVDHSIVLYLCGPTGEFVEFFTQRTLVNDIVDKISAHKDVKGSYPLSSKYTLCSISLKTRRAMTSKNYSVFKTKQSTSFVGRGSQQSLLQLVIASE
eukprot:gene6113-12380_t